METKRHNAAYFISRKNVLPWLACGLLSCSAVIRIVYFCVFAEIPGRSVLSQVIFPVLVSLWFAISVLCSGPERLYRTTVPVILIILFCAFCADSPRVWTACVVWLVYLAAATAYLSTVSGMWSLRCWLLPVLGLVLVMQTVSVHTQSVNLGIPIAVLPSTAQLLMLLSVFVVCCAMRRQPADGTYRKHWGDRTDGRLVRTLNPMAKVAPYIMVNRNGASNLIQESVEISEMDRYVHEKRREGMPDFGILHAILASYVRTVAEYPALNRFLSGQKVYSRDRRIEVVMAIKKEMSTKAPDTMISVYLDAGDTAEDVYRKFQAEIDAVKATSELDSGFDNLAALIDIIPGVLLKATIWLLKLLDYFGLLPAPLLKLSPFHGSMIITSMGSLGIPPIFHHLYDFGNLPIFVAFGHKYRQNEVRLDGTIIPHKYVDFCYVCDERICDGFYYATALKHLRQIMMHPDQLDQPPAEVKRDID